MRISIRTLFLLAIYTGICSLVFLHSSLWIGTVVVAATIVFFGMTTINAAYSRSAFPLAFSVAGWSWLVFCFGFYAEFGPNGPDVGWLPLSYHLGLPNPYESPKTNDGQPKNRVENYGALFSIHQKGPIAHWKGLPKPIPSYLNLIRLEACLSAIVFGVLVGTIASFWSKKAAGVSRIHPKPG